MISTYGRSSCRRQKMDKYWKFQGDCKYDARLYTGVPGTIRQSLQQYMVWSNCREDTYISNSPYCAVAVLGFRPKNKKPNIYTTRRGEVFVPTNPEPGRRIPIQTYHPSRMVCATTNSFLLANNQFIQLSKRILQQIFMKTEIVRKIAIQFRACP